MSKTKLRTRQSPVLSWWRQMVKTWRIFFDIYREKKLFGNGLCPLVSVAKVCGCECLWIGVFLWVGSFVEHFWNLFLFSYYFFTVAVDFLIIVDSIEHSERSKHSNCNTFPGLLHTDKVLHLKRNTHTASLDREGFWRAIPRRLFISAHFSRQSFIF